MAKPKTENETTEPRAPVEAPSPVEALPIDELKTPDTAPLEKPDGMLTWEEYEVRCAARRKVILGETTDAN